MSKKKVPTAVLPPEFTPIKGLTPTEYVDLVRGHKFSAMFNDGSIKQYWPIHGADSVMDLSNILGIKLAIPGGFVDGGFSTQEPITDWRQMNIDQLNEIYLSHPLYPIFMDAIHQAVFGKGQRHGGGETPFLEQPIFHYARLNGTGFLTGQAAKKTEEAASTRLGDREAFETEILGAMVYLGASVINERAKNIGDEDGSIDG